ncbi:hypothetical protein [Streptomyces laculatispora]|uniref:hypothetical protein n=1 Tax=Streptomyces laculatispora TaxID=887464 RepID=UPI001A940377|nr:hypothetical protein [Streptomyces laculatispora]MBO0912772.1 hypothetical protein [Streptomyces laculatispora]
MEEFLADPSVIPLPGFGECDVVACDRIRYGSRSGFCKAHGTCWGQEFQRDPHLDRTTWCRSEPAIEDMNNVTLRGLTPLAQAQVLYGLYERCRREMKTGLGEVRPLVNDLRGRQSDSLDDLVDTQPGMRARQVLEPFRLAHQRALSSPATEPPKDTWDLHVFGHPGRLRFSRIVQPWLREATKRWAIFSRPGWQLRGRCRLRHHVGTGPGARPDSC